MHARILIAHIQPGKEDELINVYRNYERSWRSQKGFLGATLYVDRSIPRVVSITNWETQADLQALETSEWYKEATAKHFKTLLVAEPAKEIYEVAHQVKPEKEVGRG